ncbi:alpha/beta fold hydrolase [Novosphingobium colocasiae]|nr:alpha/beta hydrolase [Novosphingobium colocasiae]
MAAYEDRFWSSRDGLKLHFRDYAGGEGGKAPVVCLPGLTRNARDFETLAERIAPERRVLCLDLRGRGDSEYAKDSTNYVPAQYIDDLLVLLDQEGIERFVSVGTSLGGLMTMGLALFQPDRIAGAVLNDIGPVLEAAGLERIRDYVGQGRSFPTWVHAARAMEESQAVAHPGQDLEFWLGIAKQRMTLGSNGRIVFDYDMKIAEPFAHFDTSAIPDMWPALDALAGRPLLFVRGALSDILSAATLDEMVRRAPGSEAVTLPDVGHTPTLSEPAAEAAIDRLLARLD